MAARTSALNSHVFLGRFSEKVTIIFGVVTSNNVCEYIRQQTHLTPFLYTSLYTLPECIDFRLHELLDFWIVYSGLKHTS